VPNFPSERLAELTGHTLAHYAVGQMIGRGQSGLVFRARDIHKGRDVALKVLWPEFTRDDAEVQRFVRSMKTALTLRHPNVVPLFGAGRKKPYCYIAMEFIEGESLTQMLQRLGIANRLDWKHVFRGAVHLTRALAFAHSQHIIHRNLTPQNVLVRSSDKTVLLGDLFLAKALEGGLAAHLTRPGEVLGDIRYMAPERLEGHANVDERSDLYSLGALMYTLLAGHPPFEGATLFDLILKVRSQEPENPKKYQMSVPDSFSGVVLRLLAKRPVDRYQSADELLNDLERMAKFVGVTL
jgi:serine/threonine-protein kinase